MAFLHAVRKMYLSRSIFRDLPRFLEETERFLFIFCCEFAGCRCCGWDEVLALSADWLPVSTLTVCKPRAQALHWLGWVPELLCFSPKRIFPFIELDCSIYWTSTAVGVMSRCILSFNGLLSPPHQTKHNANPRTAKAIVIVGANQYNMCNVMNSRLQAMFDMFNNSRLLWVNWVTCSEKNTKVMAIRLDLGYSC